MAQEIRLPELAENVETVTVARVLVSVGDKIEVDQSILEVETDKAAAEVPASAAGVVSEIRAKEGESLDVGDVILVLNGEATAAPAAAKAGAEEEEKPKAEDKKPSEDNGAEAAEVSEEETAEAPKAEAAPAEETQEAEAEPEPEAEAEPEPEPEEREAESKGEAAPAPAKPSEPSDSDQQVRRRSRGGPVPASPTVRRLAREIGIDVHEVTGTGPGGRITEEDVKNHSRKVNSAVWGAGAWQPHTELPLPDFARFGEVERVAMNSVRRRTAQNMAQAWSTIPQVTHFEKADVTELEKLRKKYGKNVEAHGGKLTMTAILAKVVAAGLQKFPVFNASLDPQNNEVLLKKYYNIGIAVDTERGLLVPVLRDVNNKNITEIAVDLTEIAERARTGKSRLDEMQGGSFTISNLGGIGGTGFSPIVYPPEVAIMGVSRARVEPVYIDGEFQPRTMMPFSVTYDHRVIDGADAAQFARWIAEALEQPFLIFLEG